MSSQPTSASALQASGSTPPRGYRPGTLRHVAEDTGHESICSPGQPLYSTMNMIAQWFWDGNEEGGQWARIWPEE